MKCRNKAVVWINCYHDVRLFEIFFSLSHLFVVVNFERSVYLCCGVCGFFSRMEFETYRRYHPIFIGASSEFPFLIMRLTLYPNQRISLGLVLPIHYHTFGLHSCAIAHTRNTSGFSKFFSFLQTSFKWWYGILVLQGSTLYRICIGPLECIVHHFIKGREK